jgi:hypothetical protein
MTGQAVAKRRLPNVSPSTAVADWSSPWRRRDPRVIGWVRASRTGTPCGFCAMLISRGLVLYGQHNVFKNKKAAVPRQDADAQQCRTAVPKKATCTTTTATAMRSPSTAAQYANSNPVYDLNREYSVLWPKVTEGLSGNDALNAWRRYIEGRNSDATTTHG